MPRCVFVDVNVAPIPTYSAPVLQCYQFLEIAIELYDLEVVVHAASGKGQPSIYISGVWHYP